MKTDPDESLLAAFTPLLVDTPAAAKLCGVSERHFLTLKTAGRTPAPVKLGKAVRFPVEHLRAWVRMGCPPRAEFERRYPAGPPAR